jgi:methylthioribose-1-phosphate isomerase
MILPMATSDDRAITRTLWLDGRENLVHIIDQTQLPYTLKTLTLNNLEEVCHAIVSMQVRGAPLIGITAAYGFAFALLEKKWSIEEIANKLLATRPTAVNLHWAVARVLEAVKKVPEEEQARIALHTAKIVHQEDRDMCNAIGDFGFDILQKLSREKKRKLNILTHCNAGWLATSEWGTALAPIYKAHQAGIDVHVWVDETRPRNQGYLTSWELTQAGVPHTLIVDNTGGHLMQHGMVDLCIVGSDRTTAQGDVCNKIGTYLKALAAHDNHVPFYVALPTSTIDWSIKDGVKEIPIEERSGDEINRIYGLDAKGQPDSVLAVPATTAVANHAFDVTPAKYVTALITEKGVFATDTAGMDKLKIACL